MNGHAEKTWLTNEIMFQGGEDEGASERGRGRRETRLVDECNAVFTFTVPLS
jgi:hypothetical protein